MDKRIANLELERNIIDTQINTLRFLESLASARGGDVTVKLGDLEVVISYLEIDDFKINLTRILEERL
jgi:hypothetical protein